jgi:adenylosuccinate synthase
MPATVIVGLQWGDEGKAKVLDALAADADIIVRFQGGSNAGHTVVVGDARYAFHLVPSGILRFGKKCVIANGVVLDAEYFLKEVDELHGRGVNTVGNLFVSDRAHLVLPYHRLLDGLSEDRRSRRAGAKGSIGTTRRGIGPCYEDKTSRVGIRVVDLYNPDLFRRRVTDRVEDVNELLEHVYGGTEKRLDAEEIIEKHTALAVRLKPYVCDTMDLLNTALDQGQHLLFEGAQGAMLDLDFGTYPYVTSSNSTTCGAAAGAGVSPVRIDRAIGVVKAYTTRVGGGPFPTEDTGPDGQHLQKKGREFGTTTGRPRRCGWLDAVALRYAMRLNGVTSAAITKLDVLTGLPEIKICTAYRVDGRTVDRFPSDVTEVERAVPVYETLPGWTEDTAGVREIDGLPLGARRYLARMQEVVGVPVEMVSVGAGREATILCEGVGKTSS